MEGNVSSTNSRFREYGSEDTPKFYVECMRKKCGLTLRGEGASRLLIAVEAHNEDVVELTEDVGVDNR